VLTSPSAATIWPTAEVGVLIRTSAPRGALQLPLTQPHDGLYFWPMASVVQLPAPSHFPPVQAVPALAKVQSQLLSPVRHTTVAQPGSPQKLCAGLGDGQAAFAEGDSPTRITMQNRVALRSNRPSSGGATIDA
jgi:hypothetical protein